MDTSCGWPRGWPLQFLLKRKCFFPNKLVMWYCDLFIYVYIWSSSPFLAQSSWNFGIACDESSINKKVSFCYVNQAIWNTSKLGAGLVACNKRVELSVLPTPLQISGEEGHGGWVLSPMASVMKPPEKPKGLGFRAFPGWWALRRAAHLEKAWQLCSPFHMPRACLLSGCSRVVAFPHIPIH